MTQAAMVRRGECSPLELVDEAIARIEAVNPAINAVIHTRFEQAREEARRHQANGVDASTAGPFRGVPIVVKDSTCPIAGEPLHEGLQAAKDAGYRAPANSWLTNRLVDAGFVIVGRTNVPELCTHATTEPAAYGPTRNPWATDHSAGGSSGGSGAAVAAGMVAIGHGTDGGGSVRTPAAFCGLVGLKPTRGRISNAPDSAEHWAGLSTDGFLTRTVRDSAAVLDVVCGSSPGDPYTTPLTASLAAALEGALPRLRVGVRLRGANEGIDAHPEVARSIRQIADLLAAHGHDVVEAAPLALDEIEAVTQQGTVVAACVAAELDAWSARLGREITLDEIEPRNRMSVSNGRLVTGAQYVAAREWLHGWGRRLHAWWNDFDLLLTPTVTQPPIKIGSLPFDPSAQDMANMRRELGWLMGMWNVSGQPAISVPAAQTSGGLPIGAQLVAAWAREDLLLQTAALIEQAQPWPLVAR
jgi:amidase